ncbi:hypothetical protein M9Y10_006436 [Tritrichomonas musculus]|uniref:Myb-like DNA-binding domain containing protein n=1 Tax=Tritrichomonas musculus TaxID=1915356 RepID=A0ABR2JE57_9EUKA
MMFMSTKINFDILNQSIPNLSNNEYNATSSETRSKRKIRNKFTPEEDQKLIELVKKNGDRSWNLISSLMGTRSQRQCRERWKHYLSCDSKESSKPWSKEEDAILIQKYNELGSKWTKIARELPGRSDLQVKIRYLKTLKNKKRRSKTKVIESESSDEYFDDEFFDKDGEIVDTQEQKQHNKCEQKSSNAESIPSLTNEEVKKNNDNNDHDFNYGFDSNLDFGSLSSNLITDFCQDSNEDILFQGFDSHFLSWSFE